MIVYTSIFGKSDTLCDPQFTHKDIDFVCFTDNDFESDVWDIRKREITATNGRRESRRYKMMPYKFLDDDITLYIDGNWILSDNPFPLAEEFLNKSNWVVRTHGGRDCIYQEAKANFKKSHTDNEKIISQMKRYKKEGYPEHNGLVNNTTILRKPNQQVKKLGREWWKEYKKSSCRDQLSFNYVAWKYDLPFLATVRFNWRRVMTANPHRHRPQ